MRPRVFINQGAGGQAVDLADISAAFTKVGVPVDLIEVHPKTDVSALAKKAIDEGCKLLVAGGGDGTVRAVANVVASSKAALGILPLGTLNHFAKDLSIPNGLDDAVSVAVGRHHARVDVADLNGELFINTSSLGYYPEMIRKRASIRGRVKRAFAGMAAALEVMRDRKSIRVTLSYDGVERSMATPFIFVGNNNYGIRKFGFSNRPRIDEGVLSIYVLRTTAILPTIRVMLKMFIGRVKSEAAFEEILTPDCRIDSSTNKQAVVAMDGELKRMDMPLNYKIRPLALTVAVPEAERPGE